jgi:RimJ/RimL family protein N-acetyltransferase
MHILETERLSLREIAADDAAFICALYNEPSFHKYIGDKGVKSIAAAQEYIGANFTKSYVKNGFGLWLVELKETRTPVGICGFVKRETLEFPDIGFAFRSEHERKGYGFESSKAVLEHGREHLDLGKVLAIATKDNTASGKLLGKLGFSLDGDLPMPNGEILDLYSIVL